MELGTSFQVLKQRFSVAVIGNLSNTQIFNSDYYHIPENDPLQLIGNGSSDGSYIAARLKYHYPIFKKADKRLFQQQAQTTSYQNNYGIDIFGTASLYTFYYERLFAESRFFKAGIKQGLTYIPEYEEKGVISAPPDDIKLMGLLLPTTLSAYIGQNGTYLQLGIGNTFLCGPYRYPGINPGNYGWTYTQSALIGLRFEYKKWILGGQMIGFFALGQPEEGIGAHGGITIGRGF